MSLVPQITLHAFDKWAIDFVVPINPPRKRLGAKTNITVTYYLTRQVEEAPLKDCTIVTAANFLFDNVVSRFRCPNIFLSDKGTHFVNLLIEELTKSFHIQHKKMTPYHPQENGVVEAFNKIVENTLTKICNVQRDDWDQKISAVLWAYRMICKKLTG